MHAQNKIVEIFKSSIGWGVWLTFLLIVCWEILAVLLLFFSAFEIDLLWVFYPFRRILFIFIVISLITFFLKYFSHKALQKFKREEAVKRSSELKKQKLKENKEKLVKEKFAKSQRKKGLELFEGKWVKKTEIPKLKEIKIGLDKNFQNLSPYKFEKFIAKLFKAMDYETRVTQASNDYGIDVVAEKGNEKIAIQCKRYRSGNPVGNRDIQRLLGAMQLKSVRATHSIVITTSHFTVQAREQAKECAIELWDRHDLEKMVRKYLMKL